MKLRFMTSAVAAAMLLTSVAAQADWRFTRWGMSVAQVVSAGKAAEAHAIADLKKDRVNDLQRLAEGNVTEAGVALVAEFYFTPDTQRLAMVRYRPVKDLACEDQEDEAASIIGMPGRLQSVQAAGFARNPRPTSSECARSRRGCRVSVR